MGAFKEICHNAKAVLFPWLAVVDLVGYGSLAVDWLAVFPLRALAVFQSDAPGLNGALPCRCGTNAVKKDWPVVS